MVVPSPPIPGSRAISADKVLLRRQARVARREFVESLGAGDRIALEARLATYLSSLVEQSRIIGAYWPMPTEISPLPALATASTIAFPAFAARDRPFRFLTGDPVDPGPFGIPQPAAGSPEVVPDLVLVPLVAIDHDGNRLGHGKGHYDRVLGDLKRRGALLIGVGWAVQLIDSTIPVDPWDVPLDGFASPEGVRMWR